MTTKHDDVCMDCRKWHTEDCSYYLAYGKDSLAYDKAKSCNGFEKKLKCKEFNNG